MTPGRAHNSPPRIMVVDDDEDFRELAMLWVEQAGYEAIGVEHAEAGLALLEHQEVDVICLDIVLPGADGLSALATLQRHCQQVPVVMLTGTADAETVRDAMAMGAFDFVSKPTNDRHLLTAVERALTHRHIEDRLERLDQPVPDHYTGLGQLRGRSSAMRRVFQQLERLARRDVPVLIEGESGTGKELVARTLHDTSARRSGPFIALNCAAIPPALLESQLFGHERGAFTGANKRHVGYIEQAHQGTLLLDEVAELDIELQPKLLRVLQERRLRRVGGTDLIEVDFRLVSASHRNLAAEVAAGRFREDLYYRLAVFELRVPPLRERHEDILLLARHVLERLCHDQRPELDRATQALLLGYDWPGNVRELENAMQHALVLCAGRTILPGHLPWRLRQRRAPGSPHTPERDLEHTTPRRPTTDEALVAQLGAISLERLEQLAIDAALERSEGHVGRAARQLGIGQTTLYRKLKARRDDRDDDGDDD